MDNQNIKEILDKLKTCIYEDDWFEIDEINSKILLDYITNLQEDNVELRNEVKELERMCELYGKSLYNAELTDYKQKNEKANWWLKEMLKQAKSDETKAIINGTLELLLNGGDEE